jgi:hypothetical protein
MTISLGFCFFRQIPISNRSVLILYFFPIIPSTIGKTNKQTFHIPSTIMATTSSSGFGRSRGGMVSSAHKRGADKKKAQKKAEFLAECICRDVKIDTKTAEEAIERSQSQHQKWWKIAPSSNTRCAGGSPKRTRAHSVVATATDEDANEPLPSEERLQHNGDRIGALVPAPAARTTAVLAPRLQHETQLLQNNGSVKRRYEQSSTGNGVNSSSSGGSAATTTMDNNRSIGDTTTIDDVGVDEVRRAIIAELTQAKGDTTTPQFESLLDALHQYHLQIDPAEHGSPHNGEWRLISGPSYHECEGANESGQALYTLGRMSFDMFRPANLKCAMGRIMNLIDNVAAAPPATTTTATDRGGGGGTRTEHPLESLPFPLRLIRQSNPHICDIKRYDIITEIFIEVDEELYQASQLQSRRVPAILTTRGYCMIDSRFPDHLPIWFSSGSLTRCESLVSLEDWRRIFDDSDSSTTATTNVTTDAITNVTITSNSAAADASTSKKLLKQAEVIARRVFLEAESYSDNDGNLHFTLHRPIGGSNKVYVDTIYADDSLRILRGNHGSILVFEREIDNHYYASTA